MKAFILSAGRGERLRPITDRIPKPLLPICGRPIIEHILRKLFALGIEEVGINVHHRREAMEEWWKSYKERAKVSLFFEERLLGTGGALKNASPFLMGAPFIVHNCDILSDIDLGLLLRVQLSSTNLATLCVSFGGRPGNLSVRGGFFAGIEEGAHFTYTGISVYDDRFLSFLPEGFSHLPAVWLQAIRDGERIATFEVGSEEWMDIGTPEGYMRAVFQTLKKEGENLFVHPETQTGPIKLRGYLSIEMGSTVEEGASMEDCIVLGARLSKEEYRRCEIIGRDFRLSVANPPPLHIPPSGSERVFSRIEGEGVLVEGGEGEDFERFLAYTAFFKELGLPVPQIFSVDGSQRRAMLEDLGDLSLYNWLKLEKRIERVEAMYRKILDMVVLLHTEITERVRECPLLEGRLFDKAYFRWETEYFLEWFVRREKGLDVRDKDLDLELDELATVCDSFPKNIIHRDLQSKNIIVKDGNPFLIDYQGARMGPSGYDIASLLFDPYVRLEDLTRRHLIDYYVLKRRSKGGFDENLFRSSLPFLKLQRHMQALGAYAFLSIARKKTFFRGYMAEALSLLKAEMHELKGRFPRLERLIGIL